MTCYEILVFDNKTISHDEIEKLICEVQSWDLCDYLRIIQEYSDSEQEHVRKANSWALREIGKRDFTYNEKAILLAYE